MKVAVEGAYFSNRFGVGFLARKPFDTTSSATEVSMESSLIMLEGRGCERMEQALGCQYSIANVIYVWKE
jgi:hypothetical protein